MEESEGTRIRLLYLFFMGMRNKTLPALYIRVLLSRF